VTVERPVSDRAPSLADRKKVSVLMITYNQEAFIAQAIRSALMQITDFDYEVVIGDDCSTDGTRDIVADLAGKYPSKIRPLFQDVHLGVNRNMVATLKACTGQYVAVLEGDDYWTTQNKLQLQVDFLDRHPDYTICFHNVKVVHQDECSPSHLYHVDAQPETRTIEELLVGNFINTCSVMFCRDPSQELPIRFCSLHMGDWPLHVLNAQYGKIGYLNAVMAAYRVHDKGVWSHIGRLRQLEIEADAMDFLYRVVNPPYRRLAYPLLLKRLYYLSEQHGQVGDHNKAKRYLKRYVRIRLGARDVLDRGFWGIVAREYTPPLFRVISASLRRWRRIRSDAVCHR
jgi:glycosyltransferase involved in cell wall biosynthesis